MRSSKSTNNSGLASSSDIELVKKQGMSDEKIVRYMRELFDCPKRKLENLRDETERRGADDPSALEMNAYCRKILHDWDNWENWHMMLKDRRDGHILFKSINIDTENKKESLHIISLSPDTYEKFDTFPCFNLMYGYSQSAYNPMQKMKEKVIRDIFRGIVEKVKGGNPDRIMHFIFPLSENNQGIKLSKMSGHHVSLLVSHIPAIMAIGNC